MILYRRRLGSILLELYAAGDMASGRMKLGTWIGRRDKYKLYNRLPSKFR